MRIFQNFREAYGEIKRDLFEMGTLVKTDTVQDIQIQGNPDYDTKEIMPYIYRVEYMGDMLSVAEENQCNLAWIASEFAERTSQDYINPGEAWKLRKEMWEPFLKRNMGKFSYTYNERYRRQLKLIIEELRKHPTSRQAYMNVFLGPEDLPKAGVDRVPCSLGYHFIVRGGKLFMIYFMRSSDFYSHFIYDVVLSRMLQDYVSESIGIPSGPFVHYISSLHIFRKDFKQENIF